MAKKKETNPIADVLDAAKGADFGDVIVVGITKSGHIDVNTTRPDYAFLQWILERAKFELLLHEKSSLTVLKDTQTDA